MLAKFSRRLLSLVEGWFAPAFGRNNPFYHLGSLGFYFFYIMLASGVYLFIYYESTVAGSYDQLQYLTEEQWYLGGVMRSLHRYAADGMVLAMSLHLLRELILGRFRRARLFAWVSGAALVPMVFLSGIIGFWLVWDKLGQFTAVRTSEWADALPIFASPMARNFLLNPDVTDLFFRLLIVTHIGVPLFLLVCMLLHVKKASKAEITPPKGLAIGTLIALLILSLIYPTVSHERADLGTAVSSLNLDWFYYFLYPLMESWSMGAVWWVLIGFMLFLFLLPWLSPGKEEPAALVNLDHCSGCGFCADDCPYEAIGMRVRSEPHPQFKDEAFVIPGNCVLCGICTGSCPSSNPFRHATALPFRRRQALKSGIEMPQHSVDNLRKRVDEALASADENPLILYFGCQHGVHSAGISGANVVSMQLPCIGMLPPAFIEYALRKGAAGILIGGCREGDCFYRHGDRWLQMRLDHQRSPMLHRSVDQSRIAVCWVSETDKAELRNSLEGLLKRLEESKVDNT